MAKADDTFESAKVLLADGREEGAVNRAYYAMFDAFRCLLFIQGIFAKTHKGVQAKLHELYFKDGKLPVVLKGILSETGSLRQKADYEFSQTISFEQAQKAVDDAAYVLTEIKSYLKGIDLLDE